MLVNPTRRPHGGQENQKKNIAARCLALLVLLKSIPVDLCHPILPRYFESQLLALSLHAQAEHWKTASSLMSTGRHAYSKQTLGEKRGIT